MKKALLILLSLCAVLVGQDNRLTVAMDIRGVVPIGTSAAGTALSGELATAINRSGKYVVVNRSPEVLKALAQEIKYTQSGATKDAEAMRQKIGQQDTVSFLCIVEISGDKKGGYYVRAVFTHVASGREGDAASETSRFADIFETVAVAKRLARELTGGDYLGQTETQPVQPTPVQETKPAPQVQQAAPVQPVQPPPPPMSPKDAATAAFGRGKAAREKRDYDLAIREYTEAIRLDPNGNDSYYFYRALAYQHNKKDYDKAIADFTAAIKLKPNYDLYYGSRGEAYMDKEDYDKAVADLTEAIRLKPGDEDHYDSRGDAYIKKGNYDKAIADYTEAIRLDPSTDYYYKRGSVYMEKGNYTNAITDYEASLRLDPVSEYVKNQLAEARKKASSGGVSPSFSPPPVQETKPVQPPPPPPMSPKDAAKAAFLRGETASKNGNRGEAIEEYSEAIRLDPNGYDYNGIQNYYAKRAFELYLSGYNNNAISDYTEAIRIDKSAGNSRFTEHHYRSRGECYRRIGNYAKAIADYEEYLRLDPKGIYAKSVKKDLNKAKRLIKQSPVQPVVPPPSPIAAILAFERGKAAYENKDYDKAIKEFTEAIRLDPNGNSSYYNYRAMVYSHYKYKKIDYNKAIADYTEAIRIKPDWASIYEYGSRGDCYMKVGNYAQAIADYEEHLRRYPKDKLVKFDLGEAKRLMK